MHSYGGRNTAVQIAVRLQPLEYLRIIPVAWVNFHPRSTSQLERGLDRMWYCTKTSVVMELSKVGAKARLQSTEETLLSKVVKVGLLQIVLIIVLSMVVIIVLIIGMIRMKKEQ